VSDTVNDVLWHQLALAICEFCLNDLLDGDLCEKISFISTFSHFVWFSNTILALALIIFVSLQTQQLMTSQIRSYIEYLIQTSCAHLAVEIDEKNLSVMAGFNTI